MNEQSIGLCVLGCGIVGSGVVKILSEQSELLARRTGVRFELRHVVVRDVKKHKEQFPALPFTSNAEPAIDDPRTQVVVELMGGTTRSAGCNPGQKRSHAGIGNWA